MKPALLFLLLLPFFAYTQNRKPELTLIGEYIIEHNRNYGHTVIGGLSGITHAYGSVFYLISDDPGKHNPPRFYKASIDYSKTSGIKAVEFLAVNYLKPPAGKLYTALRDQADTSKFMYSDAEAIRYDENTQQLIWASEGCKRTGIVTQPFIINMDTTGAFLHKITTAPIFQYENADKKGLQHNAAFEAISFIQGNDEIVYCSEKSLLQDIDFQYNSVKPIRLTVAGKTSGIISAQYAYPIDNVLSNNSNGIAEILTLSADSFLVLEGAYQKQTGNVARLYLATANAKTADIKSLPVLNGKKYNFLKKELVLDFSKSGIKHVNNIEGITWGYPLNGNKKCILFISDNDFKKTQVTQLLLFEYDDRE